MYVYNRFIFVKIGTRHTYLQVFSKIWRNVNIWSIVDLPGLKSGL